MQTLIGISGKLGSGKDTVAKMIQFLIGQYQSASYHEELRLDSSRDYTMTSGWKVQRFAQNVKKIASLLTGVPEDNFENQEFKQQYMPAAWNQNEVALTERIAKQYPHRTDAEAAGWVKAEGNNELWLRDDHPMTYRDLLQKIGTDAMRDNVHQNVWVNSLLSKYDRLDTMSHESEPTLVTFQQPRWLISDMRFPNEFNAVHDRDGICLRVERPGLEVTSTHVSETALDQHKFDYYIQNTGDLTYLLAEVRQFLTRFDLLPR